MLSLDGHFSSKGPYCGVSLPICSMTLRSGDVPRCMGVDNKTTRIHLITSDLSVLCCCNGFQFHTSFYFLCLYWCDTLKACNQTSVVIYPWADSFEWCQCNSDRPGLKPVCLCSVLLFDFLALSNQARKCVVLCSYLYPKLCRSLQVGMAEESKGSRPIGWQEVLQGLQKALQCRRAGTSFMQGGAVGSTKICDVTTIWY